MMNQKTLKKWNTWEKKSIVRVREVKRATAAKVCNHWKPSSAVRMTWPMHKKEIVWRVLLEFGDTGIHCM